MDLADRLAPRGYDCVCGNLRMAARAVTAAYDRHLREAGIQASQLAVLWAVAGMRRATVKTLAGKLAMHDTALMRNLRVLQGNGWVRIEVGEEDRRQRLVSLTPEGRDRFAAALPLWQRAQKEVTTLLDGTAQEMNRRLLDLTRKAA